MGTETNILANGRRRGDEDGRGSLLARLADWLTTTSRRQPAPIVQRLVRHSQTKRRTLILSNASTMLMVGTTAGSTGAIWAYVWLVIEVAFCCARYAALVRLEKTEAEGRDGNFAPIVLLGLGWAFTFAIGCGLCVLSGNLMLTLLSAMVIAGLAGGISSRNAGTPRLAIAKIVLLGTPFTAAMLASPYPEMATLALLMPVFAVTISLILMENYEVLRHLFLSEQENRRLANADPLTGLPNRIMQCKSFDEQLRKATLSIDGSQRRFTVFCLDLDGFKAANDHYGHAAGDAILVAVAHRLRDAIRSNDMVFRVGGDEFVILLPELDTDQAAPIAERIIAVISHPFDVEEQQPLRIGVSIGVACYPRDGRTTDELLRSADMAMYEAKRRGKGVFVICRPGLTAPNLVPSLDAEPTVTVLAPPGAGVSGPMHFNL
jgi:diguanylate cyclase (GGDEF)-like protein